MVIGAIVLLLNPLALIVRASAASAWSSVNIAAIANKALEYVGRYGGAVCVDAGRSGYTGGVPSAAETTTTASAEPSSTA